MSNFADYIDVQKFWDQVFIGDARSCWIWQGNTHNAGYGQLYINRKQELAHRVSWLLQGNDIQKGRHISHKCNNRLCVNPDHLELRSRQGSNNYNSKLNSLQVEEIKAKLAMGVTGTRLSRDYSVSIKTINRIKHKENWDYESLENL